MADKEQPLRDERWVCTGQRVAQPPTRTGLAYVVLDDAGNLTTQRRFFIPGKRVRKHQAGGIYAVQANDIQAALATAQYVGMWASPAAVAAWQAKSRAAEIEVRMIRQEKKDLSRDFMAEILEPIRAVYLRTDPVGKCAIEAAVLRSLRAVRH